MEDIQSYMQTFWEYLDEWAASKEGRKFYLECRLLNELNCKRVSNKGTKRKKFGVLKLKGI